MAQVTWDGDKATIWFDEPEMVVVNEANKRDRDFLQGAVIEFLEVLARRYNDEVIREKISDLKRGSAPGLFGRLGEMRLG